MSDLSEMTARHAATLAELATIGMGMARVLQAEVESAETPEVRLRAVATYPRIARAVRQCLALEAKFVADAGKVTDAATEAADAERDARRERRRRHVKWRVEAIVHDRYGLKDSEDYNEELEAWLMDVKHHLHEDVLDPERLDQPFEVIFASICADLGLTRPVTSDEDDDDPEDDAEDEDDAEAADIPTPAALNAARRPPEPQALNTG